MMNILFFVGVLLLLAFIVITGHRYLQMVWWSVSIFGFKKTLSDIRGLTHAYLALANIFVSSDSLLKEFTLGLYQAGVHVKCSKHGNHVTHHIYTDHPLNPYSTELMAIISTAFCGDSLWLNRNARALEQDGYEVLKIGYTDVNLYGLAPITLIYYHLTRHNQITGKKSIRAPYGHQRDSHRRTTPNYNDPQHVVPTQRISNINP